MTQSVHHPNGNPLPCFKLKQGAELFTDHAGLALVGSALAKFARVRGTLDKALPKRSGLSVGEIVTAYVGLLCTGKSDFDAIENHRQDGFFVEALGLGAVPAASTLRMQLNTRNGVTCNATGSGLAKPHSPPKLNPCHAPESRTRLRSVSRHLAQRRSGRQLPLRVR